MVSMFERWLDLDGNDGPEFPDLCLDLDYPRDIKQCAFVWYLEREVETLIACTWSIVLQGRLLSLECRMTRRF